MDTGSIIRPSFCRFCGNACPILVEVEDGRAVAITGDASNDIYQGYTCVKGRALAEQHNHPDRLLHSQKRRPDGTFGALASGQAIEEIAARLAEIVERHGPNSVALYTGTACLTSPLMASMAHSFMRSLGSSLVIGPMSIDQPGKDVAKGLLGTWGAPSNDYDDPDVGMVFGSNPFVTYMSGIPFGHPGKWLQRWSERGFELIVIDPRRTDLAKRASIHLQPRPGEDVSILAGILHVVLAEDLQDQEFIDENVSGLDQLRELVAPFTPAYVAARAEISADDLVAAARTFARGTRGVASAGTGPSMSGSGTLFEYLLQVLNTVCGRWLRAGETVRAPGSLIPPLQSKAQARAPFPAYDLTDPLPGSGLRGSLTGLPIAGVPAAMLHDGEDRIRAFVCIGGNPAAAWPDQLHVVDALQSLELLVQFDITMSATAQLAHYVIAPKMSLETPSFTQVQDRVTQMYVGVGLGEPWAHYTDAIVAPPAGSDLVEEWEVFYRIAQRLGLQLQFGATGELLDMEHAPTTEELLELAARGSRVPLEEIRRHPHGALFSDPPVVVAPKDPDCTDRLDVANDDMMADLARVAGEHTSRVEVALADGTPLEFRLICRRMTQAANSSGHRLAGARKRPYNPAFMHPHDLERLGLAPGDLAEIRSSRSAVTAIVQADETLAPRLVSMTHAFGALPGNDDVRRLGSNTSRLLTVDEQLDRYSGQPLMSNVPVAVRPVPNDSP